MSFILKSKIADHWLTLFPRILDIRVSKLSPGTDCHDWNISWFFLVTLFKCWYSTL